VVTFNGNGNSTISGIIADSSVTSANASGLTKMGTGTMTLTGANTYSGGTIVNSGVLLVNGSIQSSVIVATGGTFGGTGSSTAAISVLVGSTLTGGGIGSVGTFTTTSTLTLGNSSIYQVDFSPSTGLFDKVSTNGVTLNGGTLSLNGLGSGSALRVGSSFVIIDNTGSGAVTGTFTGLAQGSTISADGYDFTISYAGGTGNDVVLTETGGLSAVPEPSTYALFAGGAALLVALVYRRKTA
jgi:autotransporter-associated beta strand protein